MAELEKKFSDFQQSECKDFELDTTEDQGEKACPTCVPNPNFVLPAEWWEIEEAYLNEAECEYHVRVYPTISRLGFGRFFDGRNLTEDQTKNMLRYGLVRILKDLKKPYDNNVLEALDPACFIKDGPYINLDTRFMGPAFLIACPAFNIDRIDEDEVDEDENESDFDASLEVVVNAAGLTRDIRQLRSALYLYDSYYRLSQQTDGNFVIRQEGDITQRISYTSPRDKLRQFKDELNVFLKKKRYAKLHHTGYFAAKRAKSLKFVFKDNGKDYDLDEAYVLSDNGCLEYEPLDIPESSILKKPTMRIVYHFMSRLEQMVSEFQAKEPKPWAEWTLDHWYPTMILENKSDLDIEDVETGLACLLGEQLGLDSAMLDSLAKEIVSGFKVIEKEGQKQACRELEKQAEGSATSLAQNAGKDDPSPQEQRKNTMLKRYEEEYKNQFLKHVKDNIVVSETTQQIFDNPNQEFSTYDTSKLNLNNVFSEIKKNDFIIPPFSPEEYNVEGKPRRTVHLPIGDYEVLEKFAKTYANVKFENLENAKGLSGFGNQIQNSPHYQDAKDAIKEASQWPENGVVDLFKKEEAGSFGEIINAMGICGVSKLGKKAAQCILGNISINDFYDAMLDKTFEFIKINTLDLFLTGMPAGLRADLDEAIQQEFGGDMNLIDLISTKKVNEGEAKLSDITKTKNVAKELLNLIDKFYVREKKLNEEEELFILNNTGIKNYKLFVIGNVKKYLDIVVVEKTASEATIDQQTEEFKKDQKKQKKEFKKQSLEFLKKRIRNHKKEKYGNAFTRVTSFTKNQGQQVDPTKPSQFELAAQSFDETAVGQKVDVVFDLVFDFAIDWILEEFSVDELIQDLRQYPVFDFIGDQILNSLSCPNAPIFYPPPGDFMKGLSLDLCNPTKPPEIPKIVWPNINPLVVFKSQFSELIREKVIELCGSIIENIVRRLVNTIEGTLCGALGIGVNALADFARDRGNFKDTFLDAINEAFCNGAENPETSRSRAEELAEALFTPMLMQEGANYEGSAETIVNVISSVASADEFLTALVAREDEVNDQFGRRISNAINTLTPEVSALLGDPNQVAYFFRALGSFLSSDDRERIRDLLDRGIPNLPISKAICLTDEQLDEWNDLRKELLSEYPNPEEIVDVLNARTLETAEVILGIQADVDSLGGPFVGPIIDEINKDACDPNNILNGSSQSDFDKQIESEAIDSEYENFNRVMMYSFMRGNGLIGHALRDKEGEAEFRRKFYKFIFPGYTNSSDEWASKHGAKNFLGQKIMEAYNDGKPKGNYPDTVARKQRDDLLGGMIEFDFNSVKSGIRSSRNVVFKYKDTQDPYEYRLHVAGSLLRQPKKVFGYNIQVLEKEEDNPFTRELNFNVPISISDGEDKFMKSTSFQYKSNEEQDIRKEAFNNLMRSKIPLNRNYAQLFEKTYETTTNKLVEALLTDYRKDDGIPPGYKFGYKSETLTKDSYIYYNPDGVTEYNLDEEEQTLGVFGSTRIIALDPANYGGRYSNPKYYVEPRQHEGWVDLASKAFESQDGCEPKTPPLLDMKDIKEREKRLANTLKNDPRLSYQPDCVNDIPFKALLNNKMQAKMDAIVRSTLRTYLAEYFMKGFGLFSNLQIRFDNFDQALPLYIAKQMKREMIDLGSSFANRKIRIVKERYWYTFLEQCVEAYQRTTEVDSVEPPQEIAKALADIQLGIDQYQSITRDTRAKMRKNFPDVLVKPSANFDPLEEVNKGMVNMGYMAIAFRIAQDRENFFNGEEVEIGFGRYKISKGDIRFSSVKKLKFFQKIYFIRLFEKEATLIMSELIRQELNRLNASMVDGLTDKPYYYDLYRSFLGMKTFFPQSSSKVGTNDFYSGLSQAGDVPEIKNNLVNPPTQESEEPQFVVEKYIRFVDKNSLGIPSQIRNRGIVYRGAVSLDKANEFINQNSNLAGDKYLSDFFGNLEFTYTSSFKALMDKGFANPASKTLLISQNSDMFMKINSAYKSYMMSEEFEDFEVSHSSYFLLEGETLQPTGTLGSTGVKYGLRVCLVLPDQNNGGLSDAQKSRLMSNNDFMMMASREKSYLFQDGTLVVPLVSSEVDAIDSKFSEFDVGLYDLECLINKMVEQDDFKVIFDKIFNLSMNSSMLAIYCMETLMPSIGRFEGERSEAYLEDADVESWDGTMNVFVKNMLRKKFKGVYLSSDIDGLSPDNDDDSENGFLRLGNPLSDLFDSRDLTVPWWKRRKRVFKAKDRNGEDCADPKKDLR